MAKNHNADIKNHNNVNLSRNNSTYKATTDNHGQQKNSTSPKFQPKKGK